MNKKTNKKEKTVKLTTNNGQFTPERASEMGRKSSRKGVPNKSTAEIRQAFQLLISEKIPELSDWIDDIANNDPAKAFDIIIRLADFIIPKLQRMEVKTDLSISDLMSMTPEERRNRILELRNELNK